MKSRLVACSKALTLISLLVSTSILANTQITQVPGTTSSSTEVLPSGDLNYTVPIAAPIGTAGVTPNIALRYSDKGPDGVLGKGWSLTGMGAITRCATNLRLDRELSGINFDSADRLCLNGNRLVVVDGQYGASGSEYRTELDGNQKVIAHGSTSSGPESFTVTNPDGRTFYYGATADSRVELQNKDTVHFWALSKVSDHLGNYIAFDYFEDNASGQFYPIKARYTGNVEQGLVPYNYLEFIYEGRNDPFYSCSSGSLVQTAVKLREVAAYKHVPSGIAGDEGEVERYKTYYLSYGTQDETQYRSVSNDVCDELTPAENAQTTPYQEILNNRYQASSSRVERLARYEYLQQSIGATHVDPESIGITELIESYIGQSSDRSDGAYQSILDGLGDLTSEFSQVATETLEEYQGLSVEMQQSYLNTLRTQTEELEANVTSKRSASRSSLIARQTILDSARESIVGQLPVFLKQQVDKANRIILLPQKSRYKSKLMAQFKDDIQLKYRAATRAADECLAFVEIVESNEDGQIDTELPCFHEDVNNALRAFVDYGEGAQVYFSLYSDVNKFTESPGFDSNGQRIKSLVERSRDNHYEHLLVAGQIVNLYERFARELSKSTLRQLEDEIASIDQKLLNFETNLDLLAGDNATDEELELRESRFKLNLLESGQTTEQYISFHIGEIEGAITQLQGGQAVASIKSVMDERTRISTVIQNLRIIQEDSQQESLVNYKGILDSLLHGDGAILADRADGQANTILQDSRLLSILQCGSDGSCFAPTVFNWSEESIGWSQTSAGDSVPDYLVSYDKVRAGSQGLTINTGELSGSGDASDLEPRPELTPEQIALGRELASAGQLIDINGDGFDDWVLAYRRADGSEYRGTWVNNQNGWDYSEAYTLPTLISMEGDVPLGNFVDLNNDGFLDWIANTTLANGQEFVSTLLNTHSGWQSSPENQLDTPTVVVNEDGFIELGEYFRGSDGNLSWIAGSTDQSSRQHWQLGLEGWFQVDTSDIPFATQYESDYISVGQRLDLDGNGTDEWIEHVEQDGIRSLKVWKLLDGQWQENEQLSIASVHSFEQGQFVDLNGDNRLDWVVSTVVDGSEPIQQTLVQGNAGWESNVVPNLPALQDSEGNKLAYLYDLDGDGLVEWVQGIRSPDGSDSLVSMQLQDGVWVEQPQHQLPFNIAQQLPNTQFEELGEFGVLSGVLSIDWLNLTQIWSNDDSADINTALTSDFGIWQSSGDYRLPVLEDRWINRVSDLLTKLSDGEMVLDADQTVVAVAENSSTSNSGSSSTNSSTVSLEAPVAANDANGVKTGSLIDVNGDGRLDWVKSVRFSAGVEQKVVWLRDDYGWTRSETFLPPLPLVDFTQRAVTKIVDLDSDGLPDFLRSLNVNGSPHHELWLNDGQSWVRQSSFTLPTALFTSVGNQTFQSAALIDLNNDGLLDVLADGSGATSAAAWLNTGSNFTSTLDYVPSFTFTLERDDLRITNGQFVDLNQDGLIDWVAYTASNDAVYLNTGSGWAVDDAYQLPISMRHSSGELQAVLSDLNNDGYKDLALSFLPNDGPELRSTWRNTGDGWRLDSQVKYHLPGVLFFQGHGLVANLVDINSDGYTDFVQSIEGGATLTNDRSLWLGSKSGFSLHSSDFSIPVLMQRIDGGKLVADYILADVDGDIEIDFMRSSQVGVAGGDVYSGLYSVSGVIDSIFDGAKRSDISFEKGYKPSTVFPTEERAAYPLQSRPGPAVVASGYKSFVADGLVAANDEMLISDVAYSYSGFAYDLSRTTSGGFRYAESVDWVAERLSVTEFLQEFPHIGKPTKTEQSQVRGHKTNQTEFFYQAKVNSTLSGDAIHSYLERTEVQNYKENGDLLNSISTSNLNPHEDFFLPREELRVLVEDGVSHYRKTIYDLEPDTSNWLLAQYGRLEIQNWTSQEAEPLKVITIRDYYPNGLLEKESTAGFATKYSYDPFGNVIQSIAGFGSNLTPRYQDNTYDAKGRFRIGSKNIAREITQIEYTDISDEPSKIMVNNSSYSVYSYDGFGRKIRETMNNEVVRPYDIKYCNQVTAGDGITGCPTNAKYLTAQFSNEERGSAAETVYYDGLGREVRRATANAENVLHIDTAYNPRGQVHSRTVPYEPGPDTEIQRVEFGYDVFGRTRYTAEPGNILKIWEYDGRTVIYYDPNGNYTVTENTHFGSPKKVTDAEDNETNYIYNAQGQLVETKDASLNSIKIEYDARGNKARVVDPDHGVTLFTHNIFGQVTSKTDALGNKQAFTYDDFGRLYQRVDTGVDSAGEIVEPVTATWEYYDLGESKRAYETYLAELTEREVPQEDLDKLNQLVYLNPEAASPQVKRISDTTGYVSESTYDYRARAVENKVTLPNAGGVKTLKTDYVGESTLPYTIYYPNNFSVRYEYDEFGYLKEVKNAGLNTRDHYFGLIERAEFLRDEVAQKVWDKATALRDEVLDPALANYRRRLRSAQEAEDKAVLAVHDIDHFTPQIYDDSYAVEHLRSDLISITSQSEREARDNVINSLRTKYSSGSLAFNYSASCNAARDYVFTVPAYEITRDVLDPDAQAISVQVPIIEYDPELGQEIIIGYRTEVQEPTPEVRVVRAEPEKTITRLLPGVCVQNAVTGYPSIPSNKQHRKRERQLVEHIIGLMSMLRDRRNANERTVENNVQVFETQSAIARDRYNIANQFYASSVEPIVAQVSNLNQAGNQVSAKAYEIFIKAGRVYQFFEVEQEISFWNIESSDEVNRIESERYGNGVVNSREYNPITGSLATIKAKADHQDYNYQDERYVYDPAGNLIFKAHNAAGITEFHKYDALNRLRQAKYTFYNEDSEDEVTQAFTYDAIGNIQTKTGIGQYAYHPTKPHAVISAGDRVYDYDTVGRMITGDGATFDYTTFSKPSLIQDGNGDYAEFAYGPTHDRYYQKRVTQDQSKETFYYFKGLYEESVENGRVTQHASIGARGKNIAVIEGYNQVFVAQDEIPSFGSAEELANDLKDELENSASVIESYFNNIDDVLNAQSLVASTSEDDLVPVAEMTNCAVTPEETTTGETTTAGETATNEEAVDEEPELLNCLSPEQAAEVAEITASSLLNIQYYHYDALDSVKLITDAAGDLIGVNHFDAFGGPINRPQAQEAEGSENASDESDNDVAFGGHEGIVGLDLVHMNGRVYDPIIGRFLSADPFVPAVFNPQSLNRYSYVFNNPLRYVDPSGYEPVTANQHERNEYIFVSLAYFELEIVLPSERHLYDLLELSRNDPELFAQHITAWGSSVEAFERASGYAQSGLDTSRIVREIRKAERRAKYLTIAAIAITIATGNPNATGFLAQTYAAPLLTAGAQLIITGEVDILSAVISLALPEIGTEGFFEVLGFADVNLDSLTFTQRAAEAVARGVIRGIGSHIAGGEFEHGFAAGLVEFVLEDYFPQAENIIGRTIRSGIIEGIVTDVANEIGRDGEKLDFADGFRRGAVKGFVTGVGINLSGENGIDLCRSNPSVCNLSAVGNVLNLVIEGADGLDVLHGLVQAGFAIYDFSSAVRPRFEPQIDNTIEIEIGNIDPDDDGIYEPELPNGVNGESGGEHNFPDGRDRIRPDGTVIETIVVIGVPPGEGDIVGTNDGAFRVPSTQGEVICGNSGACADLVNQIELERRREAALNAYLDGIKNFIAGLDAEKALDEYGQAFDKLVDVFEQDGLIGLAGEALSGAVESGREFIDAYNNLNAAVESQDEDAIGEAALRLNAAVLGAASSGAIVRVNRGGAKDRIDANLDFVDGRRKFWTKSITFRGNKVFQRNDIFDPNRKSIWTDKGKRIEGTNLERMASGRAPIGIDGESINLHHMIQTNAGGIAEMTRTFHIVNGDIIHINPNTVPSGINRSQFNTWKSNYWRDRAENYPGEI